MIHNQTVAAPTNHEPGTRNQEPVHRMNLLEQTRKWVAEHNGSGEVFLSVHLNQLPGCSTSGRPVVPIDVLCQIFVAGCRAMAATSSTSHRFILGVPLAATRSLLHRPPAEAERFLRRASDMEPPSLYLTTDRLSIADQEEYRRPLQLNIGELTEGSYEVYLCQIRTPEDILHGWEYDNRVFFEYTPHSAA